MNQETGTILGHCSYSGHTADISTLEGSVRQLTYFGCKNFTIVIDIGYWSLYNLSVFYNSAIDFIIHVKISHGKLRAFVAAIIDDLSAGNGAIKIDGDNETNYCLKFTANWKYNDTASQSGVSKPIYLYAFTIQGLQEKQSNDLRIQCVSLMRFTTNTKQS